MYKSAHENFFDFILKSHLNDPKLSFSRDLGSENTRNESKSFVTPKRSSKKIDENRFTSNRSSRGDKKLPIENFKNENLDADSSKTTNELLKELAQTVKEGQSLQKDVEVLKRVVLEQSSNSGSYYNLPIGLKVTGQCNQQLDYSSISCFENNMGLLNNQINNSFDSSLENKANFNEMIRKKFSLLSNNEIQTMNLNNFLCVEKICQINLWIRRIRQVKGIENSIKIKYQQLKEEFIKYVNNGDDLFTKLSAEVKRLGEYILKQKRELSEKQMLIIKTNDSLKLIKEENNMLAVKYEKILTERDSIDNKFKLEYSHIEKENADLKNSLSELESKYEQSLVELEKTNIQSKELKSFILQLKNIGMLDIISESKSRTDYTDNKSINDELTFLRDILKDKREQEEQLHKSITLLSEKNKKLESNLTEVKINLERKTKENSIIQSILECYRLKICELEEKNNTLQYEVVEFKENVEKEKNKAIKAHEMVSVFELDIKKYKDEIELKSLDLNNALSRLGQTYVELNETKQKMRELTVRTDDCETKLKSVLRENRELNDALSNQFQIIVKKDVELDSIKKENDQLLKDIENEKISINEYQKKVLELEARNFKIESERYEIDKELKNRCIIEIEKNESLEKITKEYELLKKELVMKENENVNLRMEIELTSNRLEHEKFEQINICEQKMKEKYESELVNVEEKNKLVKIENENLLEETVEQKKMIQELIYEKIALNNEIISLKEKIELDKKQFENSIEKLGRELNAIQEIGDIQNIEGIYIGESEDHIDNIYSSSMKTSKITDIRGNILPFDLHQILQTTTAPSSNCLTSKRDNFERETTSNIYTETQESYIERPDFFDIEASLSAQCEMAYIDILEQTERFKALSEKLRYLEDILRINSKKSVLEIIKQNATELRKIGIPSEKLIEHDSSTVKIDELNKEISDYLTNISQCWVSEAEISRVILENAHKSRNKAAKARMVFIEKIYN